MWIYKNVLTVEPFSPQLTRDAAHCTYRTTDPSCGFALLLRGRQAIDADQEESLLGTHLSTPWVQGYQDSVRCTRGWLSFRREKHERRKRTRTSQAYCS